MTIIYILLLFLTILLIVSINLTLKAGKKETSNELTGIKYLTGVFTSTLSSPSH